MWDRYPERDPDSLARAEAWAGRVAGRYGTQPVMFLGLRELILAKRSAGRPQDFADLDWLQQVAADLAK